MKAFENKERELLAQIGTTARTLKAFYNASRGRDRALLRAGMWMKEMESHPEVCEPGISNSRMAFQQLRPFFSNLKGEEEIFALLLDNKNRSLDIVQANSTSQPAGASMDLRKLLQAVFATNASGMILAHNHPSGELMASSEDIRMTRDLAGVLRGIGVELVDHIIITGSEFTRVSWQ